MKSTKAMNSRVTAQDVQEAAEEITNQSVSSIETTLDAAKSQLREVARNTGAKVHDFFSEKKVQLTDAKSSAEQTIRANPFTTALAAFAAGAVVASLMKRR